MEIDGSLYPNLTDLYRIGWRAVEADRGPRHVKVTIYERLSDRTAPRYFASYEEKIEVEIDQERRGLWVDAGMPREAGDSPEACMHAALSHLNEA